MKISKWAIAAALFGVLFAGSEKAQGQWQNAQPTSYNNYYSSYQDAPGDSVTPMTDAVQEEAEEEGGPERWYLFPQFGDWRLHGFVNPGASTNGRRVPSHYNGPVTFDDKETGRLSQLYGILEKTVDAESGDWSWGGRVDLMYGTDYVFTQAAGLETRQNGAPKWNRFGFGGAGPVLAEYGLAMPQAYGELQKGKLNLKMGHFYAPVGYQVVPANGNFFISQPYTFQYGEPFTFTGGLASYKYNDENTFIAGIINGWDKFDATSDKVGFTWGFTHAPTHGKYIINNMTVVGHEDGSLVTPAVTTSTRYLNSFVFTYNMNDNWQYVFQSDVGWWKNAASVAPPQDAEWYGVNQYLYYKVNDAWKFGLRGEWFRDDDGVRMQFAAPRTGGINNILALPVGNFAGNYYEIAPGANWTPTKNLTVRSELRWDWSDGTVIAPYHDLTKDSQFMAACDAILLF